MLKNAIAFPSHKGGVGKSTSVYYMAKAYANPKTFTAKGMRVLAIDMDAQANLSKMFGVVVEDHMHIGSVLGGAVTPTLTMAQAIREVEQNVYLAPSKLDLANVELGLQQAAFNPTFGFGRALSALRRATETVQSDYDVILIDCPPAAGLLTINAMLAAGNLILPSLPEETSIDGIKTILGVVKQLHDDLRYAPRILGSIATMVTKTAKHKQGLGELQALMNGDKPIPVLETIGFHKGRDAQVYLLQYYEALARKVWALLKA